ncbi:hypothetical protein EST38_g12616 [Candolleomyces aberdarensis]|uniref:ATP-dependent DNA helicase n=1 Tax=Candolleomyces aberdarensis TaxID=2316362 RepID=A0A4Q2D2R2_9AGAR|nr:hypothetical protein EST38_g12616 [Candolleomyces aberdarensis]
METTHEFPNFGGLPGFVAVQGKIYHHVRPSHKSSALHWLLHDGFMLDRIPRGNLAEGIPPAWIEAVRTALLRVNPFVQAVQNLAQRSINFPNTHLIINDSGTSPKIAALISFENTAVSDVSGRRLMLSHHNNSNYTISTVSRLWEPLAYPLFFPEATLGWGLHGSPSDIRRDLPRVENGQDGTTTQMWHYRARLLRDPRFSIFGRLACEYIVDMHTRDLENRLLYIQKGLERRRKAAAEDAVLMGQEEVTPSENVYLPASFLGSRRWASEQVSDSLAIAAACGEPNFFVTMTCNPDWPEIKSQLRPGQDYSDIPIVVVRVFKQKLRVLMNALKTMFPHVGKPVYTIQCVEFQKRGLPHAHILIKYPVPCNIPEFIDSVVSARMPTDPGDRQLVEKFMLHQHPSADRPPSRYCQKEHPDGTRTCRFNYPQPLAPETFIDHEGRVHYQRQKEEDCIVVPHCLPLIRMMKCHINFEVAGTSHLFQYLFKYIHKGPDRARYRVFDPDGEEVINEIEDYWNARYLLAVTSLSVHLENNPSNQQFDNGDGLGSLSKLERYFLRPDGVFHSRDGEKRFEALTFTDYYTTFRLAPYNPDRDNDPRFFRERPNGVNAPQLHVILGDKSHQHLARIETVRPTRGDVFYLRVILMNCPSRSFIDARTVAGTPYHTFQQAAIALGLFGDGNEALFAIEEGVATLRTPREIRVLFIHLLIHDCIEAPLQIWQQFGEYMSFDFTLRNNGLVDLGMNAALQEMAFFLAEYGKSLHQYGLPQPIERMAELTHELQRWAGREERLNLYADEISALFNAEQVALYDAVLSAVNRGIPFSKLRAARKIVLATATSAFAAQLYEGGRTTHSTFKVPVNEKNEMLKSAIDIGDSRSELIHEASLIIWDEAPMANRAVLSCVNDILKDIMGNDLPFGGKVIILLGDFRQTCPVIRGGSRAQVVSASIKSSPLWASFTVHRLIHPIRNAGDPPFSTFVNSIGDGGGPEVPLAGLSIVQDKEVLTNFVFPHEIILNPSACVTRSILAPTNAQVDDYNILILNRLEGDTRVYFAADSLKEVDEAALPAPEGILDYVQKFTPPGVPPHSVTIKVESVCRLLRNFSIDRGLVKNVRVVVKGVGAWLITVQVLREDGPMAEEILIPRITFQTELKSGHTLCRRQFPLAPAYATTFNSCQGLTLDRVGVDLTSPVFSHGQLYTAISRIRNRNDGMILLPPGEASTTNVTYHEILL